MYFLLIALLTSSLSFAGTMTEKDWKYAIQKKNTLSEICEYYSSLGVNDCVQRLIKHNRLKSDVLTIGVVLNIPVSMLDGKGNRVEVLSSHGDVKYKSKAMDWHTHGKKVFLYEGDYIKTGKGNVSLKFSDGSIVKVKPNSELELSVLQLGGKRIGAIKLNLKKGSIKSVIKKRKQDSFKIDTPVGVAAVRGTDFRVRLMDGNSTMFNETLHGEVQVGQGDLVESVKENYGVKGKKNQGVSAPTELLPAPAFTMDATKFARDRINRVTWSVVPGAVKYTYEMYDGDALILNQEIDDTHVAISVMLPKKYRVVIRAIDQKGFQGNDASVELDLRP